MFSLHSILVDDDIYMKNQIYNLLFSCNNDTQVGQVFLGMHVPSDYYLKDQQKKMQIDKVRYKQVLMEIIVLSRKLGLLQRWVEY